MNVSALYPLVSQDLTNAEYSSSYCCGGEAMFGSFSLQDLLIPADDPVPIAANPSEWNETTIVKAKSKPMLLRRKPTQSVTFVDNSAPLTVWDDSPSGKAKFDDRYRLTRQIHKGSSSEVWECVNKENGQIYAAKVLDRRQITPDKDDAIYTEVETLKMIRGGTSGVLQLVDVADEAKKFYIITLLAEGGNLPTRTIHQKKLPEEDAMELARAILCGLQQLHGFDICHRNVKPENILLMGPSWDSAILADFGLAVPLRKDGDRLHATDRCQMSSFLAPECLKKQSYDTQADMWSFGVVIYGVLSGFHPFTENSKSNLRQRICKADYSFDRDEWKTVSRDAKRFVASLLHTDPEVRLTADEALQHPWLAVDDAIEVVVSTEKKPERGKGLRKMWRVVSRRGDVKNVKADDDDLTTTSLTASILSSSPPTLSSCSSPSRSWKSL